MCLSEEKCVYINAKKRYSITNQGFDLNGFFSFDSSACLFGFLAFAS